MPSISKSQQRLMGMTYAYKKDGKLPENKKLAAKVKDIANSMSLEDLKDFAETKHKNLSEGVMRFKEFNRM